MHRWPVQVICVSLLLAFFISSPFAHPNDEFEEGEIIVSLAADHGIDEVLTNWGVTLLEEYPEGNLYLVYAQGVEELVEFAEMMEEDPAVSWAEANYFQETPEGIRQMVILAIGGTMVDYEDQEISHRIGIDDAHSVTSGEGILVAVLDSGVDPDHEALQGRLADGGYDFVDGDPEPWEEANGLDDDDDGITDEGFGHGSMVAGIIALVAPEAEILPIRVLDDEGRSDAFLVSEAISYALIQGADVLNMSFGVPIEIESIGHEIDLARSLGAVVVSGAGNESREDPPYFPAIEDNSFMITALDSMDRKADFADWNNGVLVSCPGTGVRSAYPDGQWGLGSGCSFAVPFVSGEAALILSLWPHLTPEEVEEQVELAIEPIYEIPENEEYDGELGSGRIFLPLAVGAPISSAPNDLTSAGGSLSVFPNPSSGTLCMEIPFTSREETRVSIFDASGRMIYSRMEPSKVVSWDGRDLMGRSVASGIYYVRASDGRRSRGTTVQILR